MERQALYFSGPGQVRVEAETVDLQAGQLLVATELSAISPGTEMLVYRGLWPQNLAVDETIGSLAGEFGYPMKYGYAALGTVVAGAPAWLDRRVFSFHPHESLFQASPEELIPVPEDISFEDAAFLPNMETALNFCLDGAPQCGEQVVVFGQGVVGLLTTSLLSQFPLAALVSVDPLPLRRRMSLELGAFASLDPDGPDGLSLVKVHLQAGRDYAAADLAYELSGRPAVLNAAIECTGFNGRVVIGSWYGQKKAELDLGGKFHRSRIRLIASQVSSLAPELSGRWTKERRFAWAWEMIRRVRPARLITQRIPFRDAPQAYRILDETPGEAIQIVLDYRAG
jgi:2-desacetyl-2-hydroxyethyl bacteriochlorophyllide A dehydrogenase